MRPSSFAASSTLPWASCRVHDPIYHAWSRETLYSVASQARLSCCVEVSDLDVSCSFAKAQRRAPVPCAELRLQDHFGGESRGCQPRRRRRRWRLVHHAPTARSADATARLLPDSVSSELPELAGLIAFTARLRSLGIRALFGDQVGPQMHRSPFDQSFGRAFSVVTARGGHWARASADKYDMYNSIGVSVFHRMILYHSNCKMIFQYYDVVVYIYTPPERKFCRI